QASATASGAGFSMTPAPSPTPSPSSARRIGRIRFMRRFPSEGHDTVGDLLAPPRLLGARDLAATAICDPRAGDAVVFDLVVPRDIRRAHDAGNLQIAQLEIDPHLLIALNGQM